MKKFYESIINFISDYFISKDHTFFEKFFYFFQKDSLFFFSNESDFTNYLLINYYESFVFNKKIILLGWDLWNLNILNWFTCYSIIDYFDYSIYKFAIFWFSFFLLGFYFYRFLFNIIFIILKFLICFFCEIINFFQFIFLDLIKQKSESIDPNYYLSEFKDILFNGSFKEFCRSFHKEGLSYFRSVLDVIGVQEETTFILFMLYAVNTIFLYILWIILIVAYTTLFERKILGRTQLREGPLFVGFFGFLQPIADALKLLLKEVIVPAWANKLLHLGSPIVVFFISFASWSIIPLNWKSVILNANLGIILLLAFSSVNVYSILISGWASNSRYSFLGSLRAAAQMISYEVTLGVILLQVIVVTETFNLTENVIWQLRANLWLIGPLLVSFILFFIASLAETNRSPFDLPEAESELVSGYNTEFSSIPFALFFLAEYSNIVLLSNFMVILFFGGWGPLFTFVELTPECWYFLKYFIVLTVFMIVRSTLPRYRYDQLMRLGWKVYVPVSILFLILGFFVNFC